MAMIASAILILRFRTSIRMRKSVCAFCGLQEIIDYSFLENPCRKFTTKVKNGGILCRNIVTIHLQIQRG